LVFTLRMTIGLGRATAWEPNSDAASSVLVCTGDIGRHHFGRDIRVGIDVSHGSVGLSASGGVRRAARCVFAEDRATCVFSGRCREETEDRPSRCSHRGHFS
jgi:hypothetical protein